jgi:hypothetical protein
MPSRIPTFRPSRLIQPVPRRTSRQRGYDAAWEKFRRWFATVVPAICGASLENPLPIPSPLTPDPFPCGRAGPSAEMHLDHKVPLSEGGARLDPDNVQWLCRKCHNRKTALETNGGSSSWLTTFAVK